MGGGQKQRDTNCAIAVFVVTLLVAVTWYFLMPSFTAKAFGLISLGGFFCFSSLCSTEVLGSEVKEGLSQCYRLGSTFKKLATVFAIAPSVKAN
ncbi:hypothetical protein CAter282_3103 [Collimonas arenae]|uniref:Uncharacterized protein n=3 Tax=Collimonas arenae TaxID=279058 RepID=A0A127QL68_9BURK|nr:hypothetical protein CAter282_3103 [Collimonas arenae]